MKTLILLTLIPLALTSSAFAANYNCVQKGAQDTQVTIDDAQGFTFSDKAKQADASNFDCPPHGQGGTLFEAGDGPNSWGYRVPSGVSSETQQFTMQFVWDEDNDGEACEYDTLTCTKL